MVARAAWPQCASSQCKKNGPSHHGKQHQQCQQCGRQLVWQPESRVIDEGQRSVVERLLREKISLPGMCRAVGVSIRWLMDFMVARFRTAPEDLPVQLPSRPGGGIVRCVEAEADARPSVGQQKAPAQWLWLAMEKPTRQIVAFHGGDRSRQRTRQLWANLPAVSREQATFYTAQYVVYKGGIPADRHTAIPQKARRPNPLERCNNTLRQRVSRLVRQTVAFSKKMEHHLGAIRDFICHYTLRRAPALRV